MEVARRWGRRCKKLLDDLKDRRRYSLLKEEALDRTMWRHRFGGGFGPVVRQNNEWMNEWLLLLVVIFTTGNKIQVLVLVKIIILLSLGIEIRNQDSRGMRVRHVVRILREQLTVVCLVKNLRASGETRDAVSCFTTVRNISILFHPHKYRLSNTRLLLFCLWLQNVF